ncbi:unnamed protein product [Paramecium sonneborni]|uniref:Protein kinase domain-containing protein n=1 Tax=Paramecium sonneborni TaxID=65129 RepID=A0A8S1M632_9CILI|nr:unnamed protein product [Paramecium sonneborni]
MFQSIRIISFDSDYEILQEFRSSPTENKPYYKYQIVKKKNDQESKTKYIAAYYSVGREQKDTVKLFYLVKKIKILNLINKESFYHEDDGFIIVYPYLQNYQLSLQQMQKLDKPTKIQIIVQLSITLLEMTKRKISFNITNLNQLILIDSLIFINMQEFHYFQQSTDTQSLNHLKQFINQNFILAEIQEIELFNFDAKTMESFTESILQAFNLQTKEHVEAQFFRVFCKILNITKYQQLAAFQANSHIYKIQKLPVFEKIFSFPLTEEIIAKSTKIQGDDDQLIEDVKLNITREIELMELFEVNHEIAACFKYIRILEQSYLFMRYYCKNLREYFDLMDLNPTVYFTKLIVYTIAYQFIKGLALLHRAGIKHRDLKPENLFLTNENIVSGQIHIADFDRSKIHSLDIDIDPLDQTNTPEYNPPEQQIRRDPTQNYNEYSVDMWQYGLTIFEAANKGQYPGKKYCDNFDKYYSPQVIEAKLAQYKYDKEFVDAIKLCLKEDPQQRPEARVIENIMQSIYEKELSKQAKGPKLQSSQSFKWQKSQQVEQQIESIDDN